MAVVQDFSEGLYNVHSAFNHCLGRRGYLGFKSWKISLSILLKNRTGLGSCEKIVAQYNYVLTQKLLKYILLSAH